ncbi:MAG: restriction endonuclease subunit S [Anaerolineae bacterium]|nr:restriction endonuclease subunit S [Anaerolineae bacterium]
MSSNETYPIVRFGDVARTVRNIVDPETSGLERYIAGEHMNTDDLRLRSWGTIGDGYLGPAFHMKFEAGQILYGSRRTYLRKVALADFDGICANTTFVIEAIPDRIWPELLPFIMQTESFTQHSILRSRGSTNPYVTWSDIARYEFPLPTLDEQRRIAEILWAVEDAIEAWLNSLEKVNEVQVVIRNSLVCDPRFDRVRFGDYLDRIVAGKSVVGVNEPALDGEYGVLKVSAVGEEGFIVEENKRLINSDDFIPEFGVCSNDLLITRANTTELVGRVCIVPQDYSNLMLSDKTLRLEVSNNVLSKVFLLEVLRSQEARNQLAALATGTSGSMKNISQGDIRSLKIPLPDRSTQAVIDEKILAVQTQKRLLHEHLELFQRLKKALLNRLMQPLAMSVG